MSFLPKDELWALLLKLLQEIVEANPLNCYAGGRPPQRSYEAEMKGIELWAYVWASSRLRMPMYLKFALKKDPRGNWQYLDVDVHESRTKEDL